MNRNGLKEAAPGETTAGEVELCCFLLIVLLYYIMCDHVYLDKKVLILIDKILEIGSLNQWQCYDSAFWWYLEKKTWFNHALGSNGVIHNSVLQTVIEKIDSLRQDLC